MFQMFLDGLALPVIFKECYEIVEISILLY